jgi:hypothetical protein
MRGRFLFLVGIMVATGACDKPPTPTEVRKGLLDNLPPVVADLNGTGTAISESDMAAAFDSTLGGIRDAFPQTFEQLTVAKLPATDAEVEADLRDLVERIFSDANHEGDGVFRVHGDILCDDAEPDYADCVQQVEAMELRIRVDIDGDIVSLTLLVGPDRAEPISLAVGANSLEVTVDLGGARSALLHVASVTGDELELPGTMKGRISASLRRNAVYDWTAALAIRQAIEIVGTIDAGQVAIAVAARDPLVSVRANGNTKELTATVDVGPVQVSLPWRALEAESTIDEILAIDLRGLTGHVTLADGQQTLTLEDVGLGDGTSTVKLGGETVLSLDFNAATGRTADITIAPSAALPIVSFAPGFVLALGVHLQPFADAGEEVEPYLLDEVYTFSAGQAIQPVAPTGTFPGGLRAVTGGIQISAANANASVNVAAGQCLVEDAVASDEHPLLGRFAVVACP